MKKNRSMLWRIIHATLYLALFFVASAVLFLLLKASTLDDEIVDKASLQKSMGGDKQ